MQRSTRHVDCYWHQQFRVRPLPSERRHACVNIRQLDLPDHQPLSITQSVKLPLRITVQSF